MNLESVYIEHQSELQLHLARIVDCPEIAAELVQECFIIFSRESQKQVIEHPRGFLFRAARNLAYDHIKHRKVTEKHVYNTVPTLDIVEEAPSEEQLALVNEKMAIFSSVVEELPERARKAFVLNRVYGMTYAEIAVEMNVSDSAVEKLLARALLHCRTQFKKRQADLSND
ncbi:RNA polymerase sigma factor [Methylomonas rivi]|uniref:RNA polymerase sigma factor n=1 Tax=Methylomonas rivi TaxID=2952226 RepID=A0ABT1U7F5_9GAMM|nr:RNA polymerase sigma factor [Methylomonas sp. WSC-6]MBS4027283.1 RNA polymerase sigma factor [Ignavibacteriales bacterium]MCQ8129795.1 RNA polymerase sigma factor [Methylomonas sp. WSC-6]